MSILLNRYQRQLPSEIKENLCEIQCAVNNSNLCEIFGEMARRLCQSQSRHFILGSHVSTSEVAKIVERTKEDVNALGPFMIQDPTNASKHHEEAKYILIRGYMDLNKLKVKPYSTNKVQSKLDPAIQADKEDHDREIAGFSEPETSKTMFVYFMDDPSKGPERIDQDWTQYMEIVWYITNKHDIEEPDIWIRHKGKHNLTKNGLYWEYVRPKDSISQDMTSLELDIVDLTSRNRYIVALLHGEDGSESPVVLNIGRSGGACCRPNCGTLQAHLQNNWPTKVITRALRISDRSADMLSRALNETTFDNQKHDLYLRWEDKQQTQVCLP
ncbi:hypothetical protein CPB86DRAFT_875028 [Serendipita vermifera]|nr:hypothetical protein CPB86DRAFT_875028 [Serendipita vermifera]